MKESVLQAKIVKDLVARGFIADNITVGNKAGVLDIVACSPKGKYVSIEVKRPDEKGVESKLQVYRRKQVNKRSGIAFVVDSFDEYVRLIEQSKY